MILATKATKNLMRLLQEKKNDEKRIETRFSTSKCLKNSTRRAMNILINLKIQINSY